MKAAFFTRLAKGCDLPALARGCRMIAASVWLVWASSSSMTVAGDVVPEAVPTPRVSAPADAKSPQGAPPDFLPAAAARAPGTPGGAPIEAQFYIDAIGDSLGVLAGEGLTQAYANNSQIAVVTRARGSSGLVRDDYYDWIKAAHDLAAGKDRIDFVVVLLGINDLQPLRDGAMTLDPLSDKWREIYGQRIERLVEPFQLAHMRVAWVGLPPMRSDRFNAQAVKLNELYKEHAEKAGAKYIDIWDAFADQNGEYDAFGPDVNGQNVKLRGVDGIHFTKAGSRKLAQFLDAEVMRAFDKAKPSSDIATLPPDIEQAAIDINAQIRREMGVAAPLGAPLATAPQKPLAGPILSLTGQPVSPGGTLLTRATVQRESADIENALAGGVTLVPKPGRADDFSWPRR
jgi:uncharacterized protein